MVLVLVEEGCTTSWVQASDRELNRIYCYIGVPTPNRTNNDVIYDIIGLAVSWW